MGTSPDDLPFWDARYREQAGWTLGMRRDLLARARAARARRMLDVGCGTGALATELIDTCGGSLCELDRDRASLRFIGHGARRGQRCQGLAEHLPFANASFDISLCHFLLLWVPEPAAVLREMARVTVAGGAVIALAEPDYDGRIDWPRALEAAGRHQARSLARAGADPGIGRRLRELFHAAGLQEVRVSLMGGEWLDGALGSADREAAVLERDLAGTMPEEELRRLLDLETQAARTRSRVRYVPTFSAIGLVPQVPRPAQDEVPGGA
jgi:SAM-dependent methyltransferase